jgi:hypothetical protein
MNLEMPKQTRGRHNVGDSINDAAMGKGLGVAVIAVDYGYTEIPVLQLGADRIISDLAELPKIVFELAGVASPGHLKTIKVGLILPMTGPFTTTGKREAIIRKEAERR